MLHCTSQESLARDEHSSLLGPFIGYGENEVLWIRPRFVLNPNLQRFTFFRTKVLKHFLPKIYTFRVEQMSVRNAKQCLIFTDRQEPDWVVHLTVLHRESKRPVCWTKGSCLARALGVTKFISTSYMILFTVVALSCSTSPPLLLGPTGNIRFDWWR